MLGQHDVGGGSYVRAEVHSVYDVVQPTGGSEPAVVHLSLGVLWVFVPVDGRQVVVHRHGSQFLTTSGSAVIEAGETGDGLVLVTDGTTSFIDDLGTSRHLMGGDAAILDDDGAVTFDRVSDDELAADPWVSANTVLDLRDDRRDLVSDAPASSDLVSSAEGPSDAGSSDPDSRAEGPSPPPERSLDGRTLGRSLQVVAIVVFALVATLSIVLSMNDDGRRAGDDAASTSTSTSSSMSMPATDRPSQASTTPAAPSTDAARDPVRAQLDARLGCVEREGLLVATGTAENAPPSAVLYRVQVTVRTLQGRVFGQAVDSVAVPDDRGPARWRVELPLERSLAGTGARCEVTGVRALDR